MKMILLLALVWFMGAMAVPTAEPKEYSMDFTIENYSGLDDTTDEIVIKPTLKIPIRGKEVEFQIKLSHDGPRDDDWLTAKVVANFSSSSSVAPQPAHVSGWISLVCGGDKISVGFDHFFTPEQNMVGSLKVQPRNLIKSGSCYDKESDSVPMRITAYQGPLRS